MSIRERELSPEELVITMKGDFQRHEDSILSKQDFIPDPLVDHVMGDHYNGQVFRTPGYWFALVAFFAFLATLGYGPVFGAVAMIGTIILLGPYVSQVMGFAWPYLKWCLIALVVGSFLFPFVKGALALESGIASVYTNAENTGAPACLGRGSKLDDSAMVAAHKTLPCGSKVKVTNKKNGASVVVTIVDRGPFVGGRVIDLTRAAAARLGFSGIAPVTLEVVS